MVGGIKYYKTKLIVLKHKDNGTKLITINLNGPPFISSLFMFTISIFSSLQLLYNHWIYHKVEDKALKNYWKAIGGEVSFNPQPYVNHVFKEYIPWFILSICVQKPTLEIIIMGIKTKPYNLGMINLHLDEQSMMVW